MVMGGDPPANGTSPERETESQHSIALGTSALLVSDGTGVRTVPLPTRGTLTIGRSPECDLVLADHAVSRRHAALRVGRTPMLEDLSSRNGTRVGGEHLVPGKAIALGTGALIEIGSATLVVFRQSEATRPAPEHAASSRPEVDASGALVADPAMKRLYAMLDVVGPSALPVLVLGDTGTGKELFTRAVHASSRRATRPFVAINCAALPEHLLESELFGHERGAFTGATSSKPGLIESADGGTLFLDEVAELPLSVQAKLLRVLETGEVRRVGAVKTTQVDVRYVAATNRDLQAAVLTNDFRADLFFRLNGFALVLPPLCERPLDIVALARHFAVRAGGSPPSVDVEQALVAYPWPGNVRELRTVVERAVALARGGALSVEHLMLQGQRTHSTRPPPPRPVMPHAGVGERESRERERIVEALHRTSGNQTEAARHLGVSRRTLINKIERYGLGRPRKTAT
jgi:two-component system response regulator AtoC